MPETIDDLPGETAYLPECPLAGALCEAAVEAANFYIDQEEERLAESHQRKLSRSIFKEREKSLVLCSLNAIVTVFVLLVVSYILVEYSYDLGGYYATGGMVVAIVLIGGLMPLVLFWLEQHWMEEDD